MKSHLITAFILFFIFGCFNSSISAGPVIDANVHFYDADGYFPESEQAYILNAFTNEAVDIKSKILHVIVSNELDLNSFRKLSNEGKDDVLDKFALLNYEPFGCFVIIIDPDQSRSEVIFRDRKSKLDASILANINALFLVENLEQGEHSIPISKAIQLVIKEVNRAAKEAPILERNKQQKSTDTDAYSARFWDFLYVVILITLGYFGYMCVKYRKSGHYYEMKSFHALDRLVPIVRKVLSVLIIGLLLFLLYHYIYFMGEVFFAGVILVTAYLPMTNFFLYLGFMVKDGVKLKRDYGRLDYKEISIVPAILLIRPEMTSFQLFEITFNSLILNEQICLHVEWKQFRNGRERKYFRVEKGREFNFENAKPYERPLLEPFRELEMEYGYYLHQYLGMIDENLVGLKYFKKDLVSSHLINYGLLSKKDWLFNVYKPNDKGEVLTVKLKEEGQKLYTALMDEVDDQLVFEQVVNKAKDKLLLIHDKLLKLKTDLSSEQAAILLSLDNAKINFYLKEELEHDTFDSVVGEYFKQKIYANEDMIDA